MDLIIYIGTYVYGCIEAMSVHEATPFGMPLEDRLDGR